MWAACDDSPTPQRLHEVPHREPLLDVVLGVEVTPRVDVNRPFLDNQSSQGDVGGDDDVLLGDCFHDVPVGCIRSLGDADR